jgi:hypothetical protein
MAQRKPPLRKKLNVEELLNDVARIKNDFLYILSERWYYSVAPLDSELYGKPDLFGPKVAKKFGFAGRDIEHAGNCLALSEPTACVFHLMRAMEGVVRYLAKRLDVTINPKDTWGGILKHMDQGIEKLPEKTAAQKRKKEKWAECRAQLWQLKQAWRDNSMHAKVTYDVREARQVLEHSRTFMQHLATL